MRIAYLTHSLASCWNHGNAHFIRGLARALTAEGHDVLILEPRDAWSRVNLVANHGESALDEFRRVYPDLKSTTYETPEAALAAASGAELVIVHEWTDPGVVAAFNRARSRGGAFRLLFHDTHHRAVSEPKAMRAYDLDAFDGVLAFGESLAEVYRGWGWGRQVHVWHEAADVTVFRPLPSDTPREGLVWVGNWGDGERTQELKDYLLQPAQAAGLPLEVHGVRYPGEARRLLQGFGARYGGWLANARAPAVYAAHLATVHVPRRFYVERLPGIPTIRVFEALACGIPLASAPWRDEEGLFAPGEDFLVARTPQEMTARLRELKSDEGLRRALSESGLGRIRSRHTCAHRAAELMAIVDDLNLQPLRTGAALA
ncbi:MAG: glycosyltransferase [Phenylobacterium sp.]|uniref:CgeB family protein n=1 Tax=Phenylobacterium sp. TaxID=1871053 RepID=UPI0039193975